MACTIASSASQGSIAGCCVPWPEKSSAKLMAPEQPHAVAASSRPPRACRPRRRATGAARRSRRRWLSAAVKPVGPRAAAGVEEAARRALRVAQPGQAAAVSEVAVVQHGHDVEQGVEPRLLRRQAARAERTAARAPRSRTAPESPAPPLRMRCAARGGARRCRRAASGGARLRAASASPQCRRSSVAQRCGSRRDAPRAAHRTGRRAQQAQHEDRAAVRVDAAGCGQHARFGRDAAALERRNEVRAGEAGLGDAARSSGAARTGCA